MLAIETNGYNFKGADIKMSFKIKKENYNSLREKFITHPTLVAITSNCIRSSLEIYLGSFKEDFNKIANNCGVNWNEEDVLEVISTLYDVCTFTIPATINQTFKDKAITKLYINVWMETEPGKNKLEIYDYFQKIIDEFNMDNIFMLFPFLLATSNRPFFEKLLADKKLAEVSFRAISFTNDLVIAFCENNPIINGYTGDYIAQKVGTTEFHN
ncbi:MAG: hypothetical protein KAR64_03815 [Thermoplasmatales archaeon]|nr:hypothetical protein [Thermoplasmatales archaeon]